MSDKSLYVQFQQQYEKDKKEVRKASLVIKGDERPWEQNTQAKLKYLIHPELGTAIRTFTMFIGEIPPGGKSGKHSHHSEAAIYILKGRGYSVIGDVQYDWKEGDVVCVPVAEPHQHFNADAKDTVRYLACTPMQLFQFLGLGDLIQIEDQE